MVSIETQLEYIHNLKYILINFKEDYNKLNTNIKSLIITFYINKLPNTLIKLYILDSSCYELNNLPLNLKKLSCVIANCNLPPNIIYVESYYFNMYNLPRSLQYINIANTQYNKNKIPKEFIDHHYNKNNINFINKYCIIKYNKIESYFSDNIGIIKKIYKW